MRTGPTSEASNTARHFGRCANTSAGRIGFDLDVRDFVLPLRPEEVFVVHSS